MVFLSHYVNQKSRVKSHITWEIFDVERGRHGGGGSGDKTPLLGSASLYNLGLMKRS